MTVSPVLPRLGQRATLRLRAAPLAPARRLRAVLGLALALAPALLAAAEPCPADRLDAWVEVRQVVDGDTLLLEDGRKLRLLGINAPEAARNEQPAEPFASAARRALEQLVPPSTRVGLRYDQEREDRYGRVLAHGFLADGTNLQRALLAEGLAASIVVPPNEWGWQCYREAEHPVRASGRGMWGDARFRATDPHRLSPRAEGFWIVTGRVERVGESRAGWWLNLAGGFAVRVDKNDLGRFPGLVPKALKGRRIEARGWLNEGPRERWIGARHPAGLTILDREAGKE